MNENPMTHVIDDDVAVLKSLDALLSDHGHHVRCYLSAEEFLNVVNVGDPGCVVTDLRMPGLEGNELQVRLLEVGSPMSVIVVSGHADVSGAVELMTRGAVTVLEKPYSASSILNAVRDGLKSSRERDDKAREAREFHKCLARLSAEEKQVMHGMIVGTLNKVLAIQLETSLRTIDRRRGNVMEKMRIESVGELATMVARHGTETPESNGPETSVA